MFSKGKGKEVARESSEGVETGVKKRKIPAPIAINAPKPLPKKARAEHTRRPRAEKPREEPTPTSVAVDSNIPLSTTLIDEYGERPSGEAPPIPPYREVLGKAGYTPASPTGEELFIQPKVWSNGKEHFVKTSDSALKSNAVAAALLEAIVLKEDSQLINKNSVERNYQVISSCLYKAFVASLDLAVFARLGETSAYADAKLEEEFRKLKDSYKLKCGENESLKHQLATFETQTKKQEARINELSVEVSTQREDLAQWEVNNNIQSEQITRFNKHIEMGKYIVNPLYVCTSGEGTAGEEGYCLESDDFVEPATPMVETSAVDLDPTEAGQTSAADAALLDQAKKILED